MKTMMRSGNDQLAINSQSMSNARPLHSLAYSITHSVNPKSNLIINQINGS
jgi:hypothetical protein